MVMKVERWQAEDGTLFDTLEGCEEYEVKKSKMELVKQHWSFDFMTIMGKKLYTSLRSIRKGGNERRNNPGCDCFQRSVSDQPLVLSK